MVKNNPKKIDNKFEFIITIFTGVMKHWLKVIVLLVVSGAIFFLLQIKSLKCGDTVIQKEPIKSKEIKK